MNSPGLHHLRSSFSSRMLQTATNCQKPRSVFRWNCLFLQEFDGPPAEILQFFVRRVLVGPNDHQQISPVPVPGFAAAFWISSTTRVWTRASLTSQGGCWSRLRSLGFRKCYQNIAQLCTAGECIAWFLD